MRRLIAICILGSFNLLMYSFIGLNHQAFSKVVEYESPTIIENMAFNEQLLQLQNAIVQEQQPSDEDDIDSSLVYEEEPALKSNTYLAIPKIEVLAPFQKSLGADADLIQKTLTQGALSLGPYLKPEEDGQTIIFGHSSDYAWRNNPFGTVFTLLPQLEPGDMIKVIEGREVYHYQVDQVVITDPSLEGLPAVDSNRIVLSTCYPIGFFGKRFNVIATPAEPHLTHS